jgi:Domain of unknown function (DUF4832)/Domain of unknown function (DUF4874)
MKRSRRHAGLRPFTASAALALAAVLHLGAGAAYPAEKSFAPDAQQDFTNPERGLYRQFTSQAEADPLELSAVKALRDENISLMLRMYYLKTFRDRPLSEAQLSMIQKDFGTTRRAGVKCILRFAYSQGIGEPDAPIGVVLGHMDQLAPILRANADVIATAQAGFIGAWGEWHASTNDLAEPQNARRIVQKWLDILPPQRAVQLRTPRQKWMVLDSKAPLTARQAYTDTPIARIGHHNDCFVSSDTDVGTYEDAAAEKKYLGLDTRYVPMGGETCAITEFAASDNARAEMANLHFSYLNLGYHPDVLKLWRTDGFLQEVRRRLGYRLSLESARYEAQADPGGEWPVTLTLTNTGWAAPYNPRDVVLILESTDGSAAVQSTLPDDPRLWMPGETATVSATLDIPGDLPTGDYRLYLALPDPEPTLSDRPAYAIRLANPGLWDGATGRHDLGITVRIGGK